MTEYAPWIAIGMTALALIGTWIRGGYAESARTAKFEAQLVALVAVDVANAAEIKAVELRSTTTLATMIGTLTKTLERIEDRVNRIAEHPL